MKRAVRKAYYSVLDWLYVSYCQIKSLFIRTSPTVYQQPYGPHKIPIVVIPGIYEPWQFMLPLTNALFATGHPIHMVEKLGYNSGKIPALAKLVREYIDNIPEQEVLILAHSKGGLIGKYLLAYYNQDKRIRHMVAVNTPFSGSIYALFAPIRDVRVFSPRSPLVTGLLANKAVNNTVTSVYSSYDPNIPNGSFLEGATNLKIDTIGHFRIINDKQAQQAILEAIKSAGQS